MVFNFGRRNNYFYGNLFNKSDIGDKVMCLGLANGYIEEKGNEIRDGDEFKLVTKNGAYLYQAKQTPNGIVLVPLSEATPIGAVHESDIRKYDFKKL